jgi:hypothetical protein
VLARNVAMARLILSAPTDKMFYHAVEILAVSEMASVRGPIHRCESCESDHGATENGP